MTELIKFRMTVALILLAAMIVGGAVLLGPTPTDTSREQSSAASASQVASSLSASQLIGQRIVSGYNGSKPTQEILRAVRSGQIGGVILFAGNMPTVASARRSIARLRSAARRGGMPPLLVMIDQEGGIVKRLASLPPKRSPAEVGRSRDAGKLAGKEGLATGRALRKAGFNINLAPVADVPKNGRSFLASRAYSRDPRVVADAACEFAAGLKRGSVAAAFKHFPGLGRASGNTDLRRVRISATRAEIERDLLPYRRCAKSLPLVMLASASYPRIGIDRPAPISARTYALLADTGFKGLTVTDALDTPSFANVRSAERRALTAGLDILLYTQTPGAARRGHARLLRDQRSGRLKTSDLRAAATRIVAFKQKWR